MRYVAILILAVGLSLGVLGAATAYNPPLSLEDGALVGLELAAPAGGAPGSAPLALSGEALSPELLARLRDAGVKRVRVESFAMSRWSGRWMFAGGMAILVAGAVVMRRASARGRASAGAGGAAGSARDILADLVRQVGALRAEAGAAAPEAVKALILDRVGGLQRGAMEAFVEAARRDLIAAGGLRLFASVIDRYSAAERRLNRAWSAAADGYLEEALASLDEAAPLLDETMARFGASGGRGVSA